ncbi:MAG: cysteine-rich CWC family protein [Firmicutes bacterium]|nr:cysteine-rich CWC family protein [Bacillota bacterium]
MSFASPNTCPLCGRPNHCAMAATGDPKADCWCHHATINPTSLALVPLPLRHQACLCPECAKHPPEKAQQFLRKE